MNHLQNTQLQQFFQLSTHWPWQNSWSFYLWQVSTLRGDWYRDLLVHWWQIWCCNWCDHKWFPSLQAACYIGIPTQRLSFSHPLKSEQWLVPISKSADIQVRSCSWAFECSSGIPWKPSACSRIPHHPSSYSQKLASLKGYMHLLGAEEKNSIFHSAAGNIKLQSFVPNRVQRAQFVDKMLQCNIYI